MRKSGTSDKRGLSGGSVKVDGRKWLVAAAPLPFADHLGDLKGLLCYVMRRYESAGLIVSVYRSRSGGDVDLTIEHRDWSGDKVDVLDRSRMAGAALCFDFNHLPGALEVLKLIDVREAHFHVSIDRNAMTLVDLWASGGANGVTLSGPGMVRDVFAKVIGVQEVLKVEAIDDRAIAAIGGGGGSYSGDLIIKPSKARLIEIDGVTRPLHVEVRR